MEQEIFFFAKPVSPFWHAAALLTFLVAVYLYMLNKNQEHETDNSCNIICGAGLRYYRCQCSAKHSSPLPPRTQVSWQNSGADITAPATRISIATPATPATGATRISITTVAATATIAAASIIQAAFVVAGSAIMQKR